MDKKLTQEEHEYLMKQIEKREQNKDKDIASSYLSHSDKVALGLIGF